MIQILEALEKQPGVQNFAVRTGTTPLCVLAQHETLFVRVLAPKPKESIDSTDPLVMLYFQVVRDTDELPMGDWTHLGSCVTNAGYDVWHVFYQIGEK